MAKLTNTPQNFAATAANIPVPLAQPTGHVIKAGPRPFTVLPPIQGRTKAARKPAAVKAAAPRLKGEPWFLENFSGLVSDVVQIRHYPSRAEGFHCPPCGIAGCHGIVIRGKDGRGEPIEVLKINPETRENVLDYVINGFVVGSTCLLKYGHLDINKIMSGDFTGAVTEPAVIEPALEAVVVEEAVVIVEAAAEVGEVAEEAGEDDEDDDDEDDGEDAEEDAEDE